MNRLVIILAALFVLVFGAQAEPKFLPILKSTFSIPAGSDSDKAKCANCHLGAPPERNIFGKAVEKAMTDAKSDDLTPQILMSLDKLDSDGDGFSNGEELRAGFLPGDPKSHPAAHENASKTSAPTGNENPLVPKHTFHPALVHFPIALFLFGVALELLAVWKREDVLRTVAFWNFLGAALSLLLVVPTGLISSFRQGYSLTPGQPVFTHFLCAIGATLGIIGSATWLKKSRPTSAGYWALILITAALVCAAGYFGGELVY